MANKILVVLDPGHIPNYNKGVAKGYYEGNKMYVLAEFQKKALENYGFDVILTREREKDLDLYKRGQVAVKKGKGYNKVVFISDHSNATKKSPSNTRGVEAYRSLYLPKSAELGENLCKVIAEVMNTSNRGLKTRKGLNGDYYGVLRGAVSGAKSVKKAEKGVVDIALLIEHGFHTNKIDCAFLNDDVNLKALANAEAKCIADYFGMKKVSKVTYRVRKSWNDASSQKGAFSVLNNAIECANENPGYTVFDSQGRKLYTSAKKQTAVKYYSKYTGKSEQIDVVFRTIGVPSAYCGKWSKRKTVAKANGIKNYIGTATQNTKLVSLAKKGKLIKP